MSRWQLGGSPIIEPLYNAGPIDGGMRVLERSAPCRERIDPASIRWQVWLRFGHGGDEASRGFGVGSGRGYPVGREYMLVRHRTKLVPNDHDGLRDLRPQLKSGRKPASRTAQPSREAGISLRPCVYRRRNHGRSIVSNE